MSIESVMPSNHLILYQPLLLLPSILPSIRVFSSKSVLLVRWPKHWRFSSSISPSNEYSRLISFTMDWFDFLPRDSQESFPTPQFKSNNSSVLSLLHGPTFTSIYDHWKNQRYGKPRQHIKKQRHYFANKDLSSQSYGFSNGHIWM